MTASTQSKNTATPATTAQSHGTSLAKRAIAATALALMALAAMPSAADAQTRLQAGSLVCRGEGGWGAIITSKKTFNCTFATTNSRIRGKYRATIRKYGLDLGVTGDTALSWLVFGPAKRVGQNYLAGSLAGTYRGVGAEASLGLGLGANALLGGGEESFALQPVSVQVQTGLSIAAGVQTLELEYLGPLN